MNGGLGPAADGAVDEPAAGASPVDEEGQDGYVDEEPVPANDFVVPWGDDS